MMFSFVIQTAALAVCVILSLFTVHTLDAVALPQPLPPYPRAPKPVKLVETHQAVSNSRAFTSHRIFKPFVAPTKVPTGVPRIEDGPEMMLAQAPSLTGGGAPDGVANAIEISGMARTPVITTRPPIEKPSEPKRVAVGGNVMEAKLVKRVMPVYPPLARQARISGTVRLEGIIARDGHVVNLQVHSGHPLLIAAAVDAVRQWVYRPTLLNGQAVEVIAPIEVHFTLSQ